MRCAPTSRPGTRLAVDAVTIDSGTAKVDLAATRLGNDPGQRQNLGAQFLATVTQAPGVERVALQLEGADLQMPNGESTVESLSVLGFPTPSDPDVKPVLRMGSTLVPVDPDDVGDTVERVPPPATAALPDGAAGLGLPRDVAHGPGDRRGGWRPGPAGPVARNHPGAAHRPGHPADPPDLRPRGRALGGRPQQRRRPGSGRSTPPPTPATPRRPPRSGPRPTGWATAPWSACGSRRTASGSRSSPPTANGKDPRVDVAGVVRQPNGLPASLATPLRLAPTLTLARDAVWVDDSTLAVLGRLTSTQVIRPWLVPLGGPIAAGPEIAGARTITTVNGERGLVVTTDEHQVLIRAGSRWQRVGEGTDLLAAAR